jgi:endo-1,4-beta-xylanase
MKNFKLPIGITCIVVIGLISRLFVNSKSNESVYVEVSDKISQTHATQSKLSDNQEIPIKQVALRYRSDVIDSPIEKTAQQLSLVSDDDISLLKKTLLKKGIYFGTSIGPADIQLRAPRPQNYLTQISKYFNLYTISTTYKITESKQRGLFGFDVADKEVEFAIANNAKIKGHFLVAGDPLPDWLLKGNFSPDELKDILKNHVQTIVRHFKEKYPGKIAIWNVVNEPTCNGGVNTNPNTCLDHGVEKNIWTVIHKPGSDDPTDYIQLAFQWAHEADPGAKLYLNEAGIEQEMHPKTERAYQLVKYLKQKGTPIDGIGIESHIRLYDKDKYSIKGLTNIMNRFADLGLEVQISEFDVIMAKGFVRVNNFTPTTQLAVTAPQQDDFVKQAEIYKLFLNACLRSRNCTGFITWGASDKESWTNGHWKGPFYPHLLNDNYKPKLAFKYLIDEAKQYNSGNN